MSENKILKSKHRFSLSSISDFFENSEWGKFWNVCCCPHRAIKIKLMKRFISFWTKFWILPRLSFMLLWTKKRQHSTRLVRLLHNVQLTSFETSRKWSLFTTLSRSNQSSLGVLSEFKCNISHCEFFQFPRVNRLEREQHIRRQPSIYSHLDELYV